MSLTTDPKDPRLGHGSDDKPRGMNEAYLVLSDEERAKGFVRPVRDSYVHVGRAVCGKPEQRGDDPQPWICVDLPGHEGACTVHQKANDIGEIERAGNRHRLGGCGTKTTMGRQLAETYARDPRFYGATFCCGCNMHRPVGARGEFVWDGTEERVGT